MSHLFVPVKKHVPEFNVSKIVTTNAKTTNPIFFLGKINFFVALNNRSGKGQ